MYLGREASDHLVRNVDVIKDAVIKCQAKVQPDLQARYGDSLFSSRTGRQHRMFPEGNSIQQPH